MSVCACMCVRGCVRVYACIYMRVCMRAYVWVCVCVGVHHAWFYARDSRRSLRSRVFASVTGTLCQHVNQRTTNVHESCGRRVTAPEVRVARVLWLEEMLENKTI